MQFFIAKIKRASMLNRGSFYAIIFLRILKKNGDIMTRREARVYAMQILYLYDFNEIEIQEAINAVLEEPNEMVTELVMNAYKNLYKVDEIIRTSIINYNINRLNLVDKAIIRLAVSEMLTDTPREIIINEALEITKEFSDQGDHKATSFNNSLLDKINKRLK